MRREDITENPRMAGRVQRYHTWPTIQTQTNADHTWNVMRIYWTIFGDLLPNVTSYLIWHDCGEIVPGDVPHPVKRDHPELGELHKGIETVTVDNMIFPKTINKISNDLIVRCKICELIEMHEFACVELAMGNRYALPVFDVTLEGIWSFMSKSEIKPHAKQVTDYMLAYCRKHKL